MKHLSYITLLFVFVKTLYRVQLQPVLNTIIGSRICLSNQNDLHYPVFLIYFSFLENEQYYLTISWLMLPKTTNIICNIKLGEDLKWFNIKEMSKNLSYNYRRTFQEQYFSLHVIKLLLAIWVLVPACTNTHFSHFLTKNHYHWSGKSI